MARTSLPRKCKTKTVENTTLNPARTKKSPRNRRQPAPGPSSSTRRETKSVNKSKSPGPTSSPAISKSSRQRRQPAPGPSSAKVASKSVTKSRSPGLPPSSATPEMLLPPLPAVNNEDEGMEEATSNAAQVQDLSRVFLGNESQGIIGLEVWTGLTSTVLAFVKGFQKEVQWDTLDATTKEKLNTWAPKAEAYLASQQTSSTIFEGWLWRILVDRVFTSHNQELWEGYGTMVRKLEYLATVDPELLELDQRPPALVNTPGWQQRASNVFNRWYYEWRALTVQMLQLATRQKARFDPKHIVSLITEELGPFFAPEPWEEARFRGLLDKIARQAIVADRLFQISPLKWEFRFTDPETGKAFGFPYRSSNKVPRNRDDEMILQMAHSSHNEFSIGLPVDHVVQPLVRCTSITHSGESVFQACKLESMSVNVDFYGPEAEARFDALDREMEEKERQFELAQQAAKDKNATSD